MTASAANLIMDTALEACEASSLNKAYSICIEVTELPAKSCKLIESKAFWDETVITLSWKPKSAATFSIVIASNTGSKLARTHNETLVQIVELCFSVYPYSQIPEPLKLKKVLELDRTYTHMIMLVVLTGPLTWPSTRSPIRGTPNIASSKPGGRLFGD
ncbi:hypothetical protein ST47_g5452 [Ascochyta rabiei]|uniref:Uncharacterized protein n=1 Tax=Didymella rabiei TaxID=5454 RepID=A0A163DZI0_DIDRA|nr:hypothetical protein ST47_g5452 [Ascochyta rabiei]